MESVVTGLSIMTSESQLKMIYNQRKEWSGSIVLDDSNLWVPSLFLVGSCLHGYTLLATYKTKPQ